MVTHIQRLLTQTVGNSVTVFLCSLERWIYHTYTQLTQIFITSFLGLIANGALANGWFMFEFSLFSGVSSNYIMAIIIANNIIPIILYFESIYIVINNILLSSYFYILFWNHILTIVGRLRPRLTYLLLIINLLWNL